MKRIFLSAWILAIALSLLAACGKTGDGVTAPANDASATDTTAGNAAANDASSNDASVNDTSVDDASSFRTIGDAIALVGDGSWQYANYGSYFLYLFEQDGVYWRLTAALTEEQTDAIYALEDPYEDTHDEKLKEIVSPLEVVKCEDLNGQKLSDDALKALVGKTGGELTNEGWVAGYGYNLDEGEFYMEYGPFTYNVAFEGAEQLEAADGFDETEAIRTLKVVSVTFDGLGNSATDLPVDLP